MAPVKTRSTASKHRKDRGYKADPEDTNDDDDFYGMRELKHQLAGLNLQLKDTMGDGNCLFRACADQFFGTEGNHSDLRAEVCQYIEQHADHFNSFLDNETVEAHVAKMRKNGTYGGNIELVAFARMKLVDIKVYQPGYIFVIEGVDVKKEGSSPGQRPTMHIAYHSWEHYSSIRNIDGPHEGLPEINPRSIKQKPLAKLTNQDPPRSMERMIMNVTGVQDLELVRELLEKHHGNVDSVYNDLYEQDNRSDRDGEEGNAALDSESIFERSSLYPEYNQNAVKDNESPQIFILEEARVPSSKDHAAKDEEFRSLECKKLGSSSDSPSPSGLTDAEPAKPNSSSHPNISPPAAAVPSSLSEPTKVVVPTKRVSSQEKRALAKRNQKLNKKNKSKIGLPNAQTNPNTNGKSKLNQEDSSLNTEANRNSNMRELFV